MDKSVSHVTRLVSAQFHYTFDISLALAVVAAVEEAAVEEEAAAVVEVEEAAVGAV